MTGYDPEAVYWERHPHSEPSHHVGPCDRYCRAGAVDHPHRDPPSRLYRGASGARTRDRFVEGYRRQFRRAGEGARAARRHAERVYGATVGKVRREQMAAERRRRRR